MEVVCRCLDYMGKGKYGMEWNEEEKKAKGKEWNKGKEREIGRDWDRASGRLQTVFLFEPILFSRSFFHCRISLVYSMGLHVFR